MIDRDKSFFWVGNWKEEKSNFFLSQNVRRGPWISDFLVDIILRVLEIQNFYRCMDLHLYS
jgi:hypothetical protein